MTVAEMIEQTLKPKTKPVVDAAEQLAQLYRRHGELRDTSPLEASAEELQSANAEGSLVCWRPCKLVEERGVTKFAPGDKLPALPATHVLLNPDRRLLTTAARWQAAQERKKLDTYLQQAEGLKARHRQATAQVAGITADVARLERELAEAKTVLRTAQAELRSVEGALRTFVAGAPS